MATVNRIAILAVGLIGGSLAKAVKAKGFASEVVGWGRRESSLQTAKDLGVIDSYSLDLAEAVQDAEIIVICTPTLIAETVLKELLTLVGPETVITDGASVKGNLLRVAQEATGSVPDNLVLAHPIAGSHESGVTAAKADLYEDHRVIITPTAETSAKAQQLVTEMWQATGAEVVTMSVGEHDEILAATSHLPHILAYALVDALAGHSEDSEQENVRNIFRFAAGGFRDFTRIASSDPKMWHDISLANKEALLRMIDLFSDNLSGLRAAIATENSDEIFGSYERAKAARDEFSNILSKQNQSTITDE
jgi:prephenate dehydrogenase